MTEIEEIQNPECDSERWWALAARHPLEAMASALYWMLTLESPERWEKMQRENIGDWLYQATKRLRFRESELFASDCAERVLHLYDREFPGDTRVRDASAAEYKERLWQWERVQQYLRGEIQ